MALRAATTVFVVNEINTEVHRRLRNQAPVDELRRPDPSAELMIDGLEALLRNRVRSDFE